eukprot:gnl/Hemi2/6488_TR2219_c0_g1_i1.p1 gnl/Hemi2/6488_TR2219_c0_g1~~gnl/Hemi2/6488_TR2219_c0_g1_i1.p1  ORF type:complete len:398 (+),score=102.55 gnl/Hemi2/6488_TR2219_c0_g1_i1:117-1310(+)
MTSNPPLPSGGGSGGGGGGPASPSSHVFSFNNSGSAGHSALVEAILELSQLTQTLHYVGNPYDDADISLDLEIISSTTNNSSNPGNPYTSSSSSIGSSMEVDSDPLQQLHQQMAFALTQSPDPGPVDFSAEDFYLSGFSDPTALHMNLSYAADDDDEDEEGEQGATLGTLGPEGEDDPSDYEEEGGEEAYSYNSAEEDEDEDTAIDKYTDVHERFGDFGWFVSEKLHGSKILPLDSESVTTFAEGMVLFYLTLIRDKDPSQGASYLLETQLFANLPTLAQINARITTLTPSSEGVLVKIILEMYEAWLKRSEFPLFTKYRTELLPLAQKFYSSLTDDHVSVISNQMSHILYNIYQDRDPIPEFLSFTTRTDYLNHYRETLRSFCNASEGCSADLFYI